MGREPTPPLLTSSHGGSGDDGSIGDDWSLLETLLLHVGGGGGGNGTPASYAFLRGHARRMAASARFFLVPLQPLPPLLLLKQQEEGGPASTTTWGSSNGVGGVAAAAASILSCNGHHVSQPTRCEVHVAVPNAAHPASRLQGAVELSAASGACGGRGRAADTCSAVSPSSYDDHYSSADSYEDPRVVASIESFLTALAAREEVTTSPSSPLPTSPWRRVRLLLDVRSGGLSAEASACGEPRWETPHPTSAVTAAVVCGSGGDTIPLSFSSPASPTPFASSTVVARTPVPPHACMVDPPYTCMVGLTSPAPVDSEDVWLYHKSTRRGVYDSARALGGRRLAALMMEGAVNTTAVTTMGVGGLPSSATTTSSRNPTHGGSGDMATSHPSHAAPPAGTGAATAAATAPSPRQIPPYDVLLWNPAGELTEFCIGNVVLELLNASLDAGGAGSTASRSSSSSSSDGGGGSRLFTPFLASGCLPGVFREALIGAGTVTERVLTLADLRTAVSVWLVNSVRGWVRVEMVVDPEP